MGTAAQNWMGQGRTEGKVFGIAKGRAAGKVDTFLRLARLKLGELRRNTLKGSSGASSEQLDALMTAEGVNAVFRERTGH